MHIIILSMLKPYSFCLRCKQLGQARCTFPPAVHGLWHSIATTDPVTIFSCTTLEHQRMLPELKQKQVFRGALVAKQNFFHREDRLHNNLRHFGLVIAVALADRRWDRKFCYDTLIFGCLGDSPTACCTAFTLPVHGAHFQA